MALTTELLTVLDNNEEPLQKRLRIANNAFNSNELLALNKESLILEWIVNRVNAENTLEIWKTLNSCLTEQHMRNLRPNDIKINVLDHITATITKHLNDSNEFKIELLQCATIIFNNELFQHYFKHNTKRFCEFIATFLLNINDVNELNDILKIYLSFNKQIIIDSNYTIYYLKYVLNTFVDLLIKYDDNILFENCVALTQRILFGFTSKEFKKFINSVFTKNDEEVDANSIIKKLEEIYKINDEQKSRVAFKLIFVAFINAHKNDPIKIYQFFVLIVRYVGFKIDHEMNIILPESEINYNLDVSLNILAEILEIISKENITMNDAINNVKFSEFLVSLLTSIIRIAAKPSQSILKIMKNLIIIDPTIIAGTIAEILVFLCCAMKDDEIQNDYSQLMIGIFEMYLKLHRFHKFCSELLKSIHDGLFSLNEVERAKFEFTTVKAKNNQREFVCFVRDVFPENVACYFRECITQQTNKQIISIMRTFITNLNEISENLNEYNEVRKMLYIQIVSDLTCQFLTAVRIAEHTTTEITIDKFFKDINDLKEFLKKFGGALLKLEHNQNLMFSFLNLCYNWGENTILLNYYIPNNQALIEGSVDNSANNLTYLHNYLSTDQWSLVSQRIKNFGEQPCKRILQKLIIQKLRAVLLFESDVNETLETSVISSYSSNLETCWDIIFTERFITANFFTKMENSQLISLAELLINDILAKSNFHLLANKKIIDNRDLVQSILYVCLSKINHLFKKKRRHSDASLTKPLSRKLFECIDQNSFIRDETLDIEKLSELFRSNEMLSLKIDGERFHNLMEIIKYIPVYSLSHDIQTTLFLFLLSICTQTQNAENAKNKELCEKYLIGLVENTTSANILNNVNADILLRTIIENTQQYKEILNYCVNKTLKQNESIAGFKVCLNILLKHVSDERYLNVALVSFHGINKAIKYKITDENKENLRKYKQKLCKHLFDVVVEEDDKIEAYVLVLQKCLLKDAADVEKLDKLLSVLNKYIDYTLNNMNENNAKGCLLLHELILTNKTNIKDVPSDFIISVWKCCKDLKKHEDYSLNYDKTITLLFEHISIEEFPIILEDLLKSLVIYLKNHELDKVTNQFGIWRNLINSSINSAKLKLCHNSLQSMLEETMLYLINNNTTAEFCREYVKLQINIMENKQITQSSNIIDIYLQTCQIIITKQYANQEDFIDAFDASFSLLEAFLKYRKILVIDRLAAYLVQLRNCIYELSKRSDSEQNASRAEIVQIANGAFRIEQLVKNVCLLKRDVARVAPYLIADILKRYEKITLYPEVRNHFNNCLNYLIDLCDSHAVSYLLRVLSTASREIFKNMHDHYKKYYKFTGKV